MTRSRSAALMKKRSADELGSISGLRRCEQQRFPFRDDDGVLVMGGEGAVGGAAVQPSGSSETWPLPTTMIGSMVITKPSVSVVRARGLA